MSSSNEYIKFIQAQGYDVYVPAPTNTPREVTYCYFTDGEKVAYAQWGDRPSISSEHMANRTAGTGYQISDTFTAEALRDALDCVAPSWATTAERSTVKKWPSFKVFREANWCPLTKVEE